MPHLTRPRAAAALAALSLILGFLVALPARAADVLLSQGKTATASSSENAVFGAASAVAGDPGTRWSSAFGDPQWIQVDLGASATINQVQLAWETAYATAFQIQLHLVDRGRGADQP